jgi:hypothetical protein
MFSDFHEAGLLEVLILMLTFFFFFLKKEKKDFFNAFLIIINETYPIQNILFLFLFFKLVLLTRAQREHLVLFSCNPRHGFGKTK